MKKILISGYYGYGNLGDEAILASIIDGLRYFEPNLEISVLSNNPITTCKQYQVQAINRWNYYYIIQNLKKSNLLISGGGGLFQDTTGLGSPIYYGSIVKLAQMFNIPTAILGQGVGPLKNFLSKFIVKKTFNKASLITVRDHNSKELLENLGVTNKINVTSDMCFILSSINSEQARTIITQTGLNPDLPTIGVSLRPWVTWYERDLKYFTSVLTQFVCKNNLQVLLIPFQLSQDLWFLQETYKCIIYRPNSHLPIGIGILDKPVNPYEMMGIIKEMKIVIGMRLHSLIMAAANCIPAIGISYDPKIYHFTQTVGFPCIHSVSTLSENDCFYNTLIDIWDNIYLYKQRLNSVLFSLKQQAWKNIELALNLLAS